MRAPAPQIPLDALRAAVEGYPEGGRVPRHSHAQDQLALITESAAVIETDAGGTRE